MTHSIATTRFVNATEPPRLILATTNQGKIDELRHLFGDAFQILGMDDFQITPAEETGTSFEENAILKAKAVSNQTGLVALADDSGLEVDALGGAPGVYSARYAGPDANDAANRALLLRDMNAIDPGSRSCRFVCVIALAIPGRATISVRGTCEGIVGRQEVGSNGFGYDSLFVLPDGRTMAQLEPSEKSQISHRAHAVKRIEPILRRELGSEKS